MGQLSKIRESRQKSREEALATLPTPPAAIQEPIRKTCEICGGENFWESIYLDGELRCERCEPAPADMVGRWVGPAAELLQQTKQGEDRGDGELCEPGTDSADYFVEYVTADGRRGLALRGYDNPRHANYNQRACAYIAIGVDAYERELEAIQAEWISHVIQ